MVTTEEQVKKCDTDSLISYASTLHYILYERDFYKKISKLDEGNIFQHILTELEKRGHKLGWTGFTG